MSEEEQKALVANPEQEAQADSEPSEEQKEKSTELTVVSILPDGLQEVTFENDKMQYVGTAKSADEGAATEPVTIENFVKHGSGVEVNKVEGTTYSGQFKDGKHHGKGILSFDGSGDEYVGSFDDGNIHGEGKFTFSNGDIYTGEFVNNEMKSGVLEKKNGDEYAGDFVNDLYDGYSLYKYANGDVYCGDFYKGKRHGDGVLKIAATK